MADAEEEQKVASDADSDSEPPPEESKWLFEGSSGDENEESEEDSQEENLINLAELSDSSDEEGPLIRVGEIPLNYYEGEKHTGYDIDGNKVIVKGRGDQIDLFLLKKDKDAVKRTLYDPLNDRTVTLSDADLTVINRIRHGKTAGKLFEPPVRPIEIQQTAWPSYTPKSSFTPSKGMQTKIRRMMKAIRNGWIRLDDKKQKQEEKYYDIWEGDHKSKRSILAPPKAKLPGHAESYNPPAEYLFDEEEQKEYAENPEEKPYDFDPQKFSTMRHVGAYDNAVVDRFDRCLDLYLCTRQKKLKLDIDPDSLLPKLPDPSELRPFPTFLALEYVGHSEKVRTLDVSPDGQWLITGSDDQTARLWEVSTGRCMRIFHFSAPIENLKINPKQPCFAACVGSHVFIIPDSLLGNTEDFNAFLQAEENGEEKYVKWSVDELKNSAKHGEKMVKVLKMSLLSEKSVYRINWHRNGDYFSTIRPVNESAALLVHRLSSKITQKPFSKPLGTLQDVHFHPSRPFLIVVSKMWIRIYNLQRQVLFKKMRTTSHHLAKIAVHPSGDHFLIGTYDAHTFWYDVDRTSQPYKNFKYHKRAVRGVDFHPTLPLCATASDDGAMHIFHAKVYQDYMNDPLVVPVKILRAENVVDGIGVLDCRFHPTQPWIFCSGMEGKVKVFM